MSTPPPTPWRYDGHGAGFRDRALPGAAALSKDAHVYSTQTPYLGDDGKIHLHH